MRKLRFDPEDHRYFVGEIEIPSLSKVLRLGGISRSLEDVPKEILERKRQIGTATHRAIQLYLSGDLDWTTVHPDVQPYVDGALEYLQREDRRIVSVETPVGGLTLGYACTPDLHVEGGLVEWKTTYKIYPEVEVQLSGQARALSKSASSARKLERRVVHLQKDGRYKIKDYGSDADKVFQAALRVAQWRLK